MESHGLTHPLLLVVDRTLDGNLAAPIPAGTSAAPRCPPAADLGALAALPVELAQQILLDLDLRSLAAFRTLNRRAADTVDSIPEYRAILRHAPNTLRGAAAIGADGNLSLRMLHAALRSPECEACDGLGGHLYLVTCRRLCIACIEYPEVFQPMRPQDAAQWYGLGGAALAGLPGMRTVAGRYAAGWCGAATRAVAGGVVLLDRDSVLRAARALHGGQWEMGKFFYDRLYDCRVAANERLERPVQVSLDQLENSLWESTDWARFVAVIRVPWLKTLHEAEGVAERNLNDD
ncbi:hypothetical protein N658DRAFT_522854 [Parathielavia hyrcaniae]|uniref:F-box domain-containing protein n=1 Tax=Parathielavia hyrcaniae TaxID=113614 RepID=A0AAN6Q6W2_9PEZI|nr:hypothetical protein N658DRAFT_522854 [Parathielavia hyrcaniae]